MTSAPIINALELVDAALLAAFTPLVPTYQNAPAAWFIQAPPGVSGAIAAGTLSKAIVYNFTDSGGKRKDHIAYAGWEGRMIVHCYSDTKTTANALLVSVAAALNGITIANYSFDATWQRPTIYAPQNNIWRLAGVWDICIERV